MALTSCSLWLMNMTDLPSAVMERSVSKESVDLLRRQHGSRLIHDEHLGAAIEHLQDLDPLLFAHRQLPDLGTRIHLQAESLGQAATF